MNAHRSPPANFERDKAVDANVLRLVHESHPATAQFLADSILGDGLPDPILRGLASSRNLKIQLGGGQRLLF
jgi:hypothetical protein